MLCQIYKSTTSDSLAMKNIAYMFEAYTLEYIHVFKYFYNNDSFKLEQILRC